MAQAAISDPRLLRGLEKQMALRRSRIAAGGQRLGWKAAFGAPAAQAKFGITAPAPGFLLRENLVASGSTVSLKGWTKPIAEPEIAVHMGRDLAPGAGEAEIRAAIAGLGPAIELVDLSFAADDIETVLAANIFQRNVVLGPRDDSRAGARLDGLAGIVARHGAAAERVTAMEAITGPIIATVGHLASVLGQLGERLQAGDVDHRRLGGAAGGDRAGTCHVRVRAGAGRQGRGALHPRLSPKLRTATPDASPLPWWRHRRRANSKPSQGGIQRHADQAKPVGHRAGHCARRHRPHRCAICRHSAVLSEPARQDRGAVLGGQPDRHSRSRLRRRARQTLEERGHHREPPGPRRHGQRGKGDSPTATRCCSCPTGMR